jgi:uncharacterized membrane protein YtjA (UPF0391 family)/uncharacterized GH25 family protein
VFTVSPNKGYVGDTVTVNGSFLASGGKYTIFFDKASVRNGTADVLGNFTNTFVVPPAVNGTHTVKLQDISSNTNVTASFTIMTKYYVKAIYVPPEPNQQLQEGNNVTISAQIVGGNSNVTYSSLNVTVTTPARTVYYNATLPLTTNSTGTANGTLYYPTDFEPTNASNTNFTGTYLLQLFYKNVTTPEAQSSFFIGLTNATLYQRLDVVNIKAANYTKPAENATVTIKFGNQTMASRKTPATNGTVTCNWTVPVNAPEGSYMVTVTAIGGANKTVPDAQNFTVPGLLVNIETTNLNEAYIANVTTSVYETVKGSETLVASSSTNSSGWTTDTLSQGGNYTLEAFWENAEVNTTRVYNVYENFSQILTCQIADIVFTVKDNTSAHYPLPLVLLNVAATYLTSKNVSQTEIEANLTNTAGEGIFRNQLVMANYSVRAYRAPYQMQLLFYKENFTLTQGQNRNVTIFCPLLNLTVHAEDAKSLPLDGYPVEIYEYGGGLYPPGNETTGASGNVTFSATFGEYQVRLYNPNETVLLNETYYNLVNASAFFLLRSRICHANLSVTVLDYFGRPVPNIEVELEREGAASITLKTNGKGVAFFDSITGGNCYISINTGSGSPIETANIFVEGNAATIMTVGNYVTVFGLLVGTSQFAVLITFIVFIVLLLVFLLYRRRSKISEEKKTEKES